ncbi:MAG: UvrD-helicase domain-containing protein, partial [Planctomycetota bacterium]
MDWLDLKDAQETPAGAPLPDLCEGLNEAQRDAVLFGDGPLLIVAGPGSGKTRVITTRIAHLVRERGVAPWEILAITFTNKAAKEMRERVERAIGGGDGAAGSGAWISTFHSMCARILRREIEALDGYTRDFSIHDTSDRNALLKAIVKDLGYDPREFRPQVLGGWISARKNGRRDASDGLLEESPDGDVYVQVERTYAERMRAQNALDFDDLLLKVLEVFDAHHGIRDAYARRFRHVLVDEYQDTNRVQYRLVRHLASFHRNLVCCGDPDQSIYAWRGADIRNILDFEGDFPDAHTVRLEENYRSTSRILDAANVLISNNQGRKEKELFTTTAEQGEPVTVIECGDEVDEAREIVNQVRGWVGHGGRYGDCAVLYRAGYLQRAIETALAQERVPYQVVAGLEFYQRREIKDLVAYLRLALNPSDDIAFARVVNTPTRGVGDTSLGRLAEFARGRGTSMAKALEDPEALSAIRGRAKKGLAEFGALLEELGAARELDAAVALDLVIGAIDVDRWLAEIDDGTTITDRAANIEELRAFAAGYDERAAQAPVVAADGRAGTAPARSGLGGFLEEIALVADADGGDASADGVRLMTLHACKGLEYPFVVVAGVEDELLPHQRAVEEALDPEFAIEEERRLLYVGMT